MAKQGKRYKQACGLVDRMKRYEIDEAMQLLKDMPGAGFDQSVELVLKLGIDPRQSDQQVRGSVALPHGIGKTKSVVAFTTGERAREALDAGAVEAGGEELIKKVQDGWADFDVAVATPDMMRLVGRLGRILGPQGKMPSPKSGTVTEDVVNAVREFARGRIEYRNDSGGNVHVTFGKVSQPVEVLAENARAFIGHIVSNRPSSAKGVFVLKATVSTTMGPGVRIAV